MNYADLRDTFGRDFRILSEDGGYFDESGTELKYRNYDVTPLISELGLTAVGACLTIWNTKIWGERQCGRPSNIDAARKLEGALKNLVKRSLAFAPVWAAWAYEAHKNGLPHVHAMVFSTPKHLPRVIETLRGELGKNAASVNILDAEYVGGDNSDSRKRRKKYLTGLIAYEQTPVNVSNIEIHEDGEIEIENRDAQIDIDAAELTPLLRHKRGYVKDVQKQKIVHFLQNSKMEKSLPRADGELRTLFKLFESVWDAKARARKKRGEKIENPKDAELRSRELYVPQLKIFPSQTAILAKRKKELRKARDEDLAAPLDITLRAANGDRIHRTRRSLRLTAAQLENLKKLGKKCLNGFELENLYRVVIEGGRTECLNSDPDAAQNARPIKHFKGHTALDFARYAAEESVRPEIEEAYFLLARHMMSGYSIPEHLRLAVRGDGLAQIAAEKARAERLLRENAFADAPAEVLDCVKYVAEIWEKPMPLNVEERVSLGVNLGIERKGDVWFKFTEKLDLIKHPAKKLYRKILRATKTYEDYLYEKEAKIKKFSPIWGAKPVFTGTSSKQPFSNCLKPFQLEHQKHIIIVNKKI